MDIVSMEFGSSIVQGTESCNLNEELTWNYGRANVVAQPVPFECSPAQIQVPEAILYTRRHLYS